MRSSNGLSRSIRCCIVCLIHRMPGSGGVRRIFPRTYVRLHIRQLRRIEPLFRYMTAGRLKSIDVLLGDLDCATNCRVGQSQPEQAKDIRYKLERSPEISSVNGIVRQAAAAFPKGNAVKQT